MKRFVLTQCMNVGGMEQSALLLLKELRDMGYETELISLHTPGALGPHLAKERIPARGIRWLLGWRSVCRCAARFALPIRMQW